MGSEVAGIAYCSTRSRFIAAQDRNPDYKTVEFQNRKFKMHIMHILHILDFNEKSAYFIDFIRIRIVVCIDISYFSKKKKIEFHHLNNLR